MLCSVCFDRDLSTRKLSVCSHLFCEPCVSNYLKSLNEEVVTKFECPVCKQENTGPGNLEDIHDWFLSLEINHAQVQNGKDDKGTEDYKVCVRCHENDKTTIADRYCFECQEILCEVCCKIGHGFKQLKHHEIISIEASLWDTKESEIIRRITEYLVCQKHPENMLRFMCREDNILCCSECRVTSHRSCNDMVSVKDCVDENRAHEEAQDCVDENRTHEETQDCVDENRTHEEAQDRVDENRTHEEAQDCVDENRIHEEAQDCVDENRTHEVAQDHVDENRTQEEAQDRVDENRTHEEAQDCVDESRTHEEAQDCVDENRTHEEAQERVDDNRAHEEAQDLVDENRTHEEAQDCVDENRTHEVAQDCVDENRTHEEAPDCVDENRTHEEAQNLLDRLSNLTDLSKAIVRVKKENETENKKNAERVIEEIQELRRKVNDVFDILQDSVNQQCKGLIKSYYLEDQDDIGKLRETIKTLDISRTLLNKSMEVTPLNVVFVLVQRLSKIAEEHETDVLELRNSCGRYAMELNVNDWLRKLQNLALNEVSEMATVIGEKRTASLPAYPNRRLIRYCDIDMVGYHTRRKYQDALYSGMATLPDDRMVLADYASGDCCLITAQYKVIDELNPITLGGKDDKNIQPRSATYTKDGIIAVSVPAEKKIYFVSAHPVAFGILSFSKCYRFVEKVYFDRDKSGRVMKSFLYMAVDEGRAHVVQPCNVDKAVYCFDFDGNPKFTYEHPELTGPLGVTIDNDGGIYICDKDHHCIHVVSPVGNPARVIVNVWLLYPVAVTYKRNCSELIVANKDEDERVRLSVFKFQT